MRRPVTERRAAALSLCWALLAAAPLAAQQPDASEAGLAQQLTNPVASLISVPFQFNWNEGYGPAGDGQHLLLNFQPVIPISLSDDWNLISRTIVPVIWQDDIFPGAGSQFGIGNVVQSLFLSPVAPTSGGIIWGAGPVFLLPTATDDLLGPNKWGIGPTAVVLRQQSGWTYGALANHIWSVAGSSSDPDINATFVQPFVAYTTSDAWTFALNTETTYDWNSDSFSVPINAVVSKLVRVGPLPVSLFVGARYWAGSPRNGPDGFGVRFGFTLLLPAGR